MLQEDTIHREVYEYFNERAPVLFLVLTAQGEIVYANQYASMVTGRDLIGQAFQDLVLDFSGTLDLNALMADSTAEHLLNIGGSSGLPQSYWFSFRPLQEHALTFGRLDADEIENMRKEVLSLNQELNNLMRELHKKNAQLKRLNEEKNQFLGMAAHDLRKPIGLVTAYSEFLMEDIARLLNSEQAGFLNTINSSSTFMKRLVDDFLDVSAIEAGKFDLDLHPASIYDVLGQSLKLNNLQAVKKGIALQLQSDDGIPLITMDAPKIEQVITNLVSNAIEHTAPASRVGIFVTHDEESFTFSVQDEGPGITKEEMGKLFKPFEKGSAKKTGGEKSTGLGMLITLKIVEAHGGTIWVDSQLGKGTTIYFKIPIHSGAP